MFGYACDETPELMPLPIMTAHKLSKKLADVRKKGVVDFLRPDGKSQVSVRYSSDDRPLGIDAVVVSTQHSESVKYKTLKEAVMDEVVKPVLPAALVSNKTKFFINPTGRFVVGGPMGDSGLTGRKIIVDTYGGMGRHGGGAFSGKDPSKVDRSACYYARYIAKNVVAAGLARRCEVQVAYAIGVAEPVSLLVHTFGTGKISEDRLSEIVRANFDCRPGAAHPRAQPSSAHLSEDRRLRSLRAAGRRLLLGEDQQGRRAQVGRPQVRGGRWPSERQHQRQGRRPSSAAPTARSRSERAIVTRGPLGAAPQVRTPPRSSPAARSVRRRGDVARKRRGPHRGGRLRARRHRRRRGRGSWSRRGRKLLCPSLTSWPGSRSGVGLDCGSAAVRSVRCPCASRT